MKIILAIILAGIVFSPRTYAQRITIDGYVVNSENGKYLKEVNIFDKVSGIGTISDNTGYFRLMLDPGEVNLSFNESHFTDYSSDFIAKSDTILNISLEVKKDLKKDSVSKDEAKVLSSASGLKKFFRK